ncbi:hypothetical protein MTO96_005938 [Rhipicephalus appendiculatus]
MPKILFCDVVDCPNGPGRAREIGSELGACWPAYHRLPRVEPRRSLWLAAVAFRCEQVVRRVCSLHFRREDYTYDPLLSRSLGVDVRRSLNSDAVPSLLLGYDQQASFQEAAVWGVPGTDSCHKQRYADLESRHESSRAHDMATQANVFTRTIGVQAPISVKQTSTQAVQTTMESLAPGMS